MYNGQIMLYLIVRLNRSSLEKQFFNYLSTPIQEPSYYNLFGFLVMQYPLKQSGSLRHDHINNRKVSYNIVANTARITLYFRKHFDYDYFFLFKLFFEGFKNVLQSMLCKG